MNSFKQKYKNSKSKYFEIGHELNSKCKCNFPIMLQDIGQFRNKIRSLYIIPCTILMCMILECYFKFTPPRFHFYLSYKIFQNSNKHAYWLKIGQNAIQAAPEDVIPHRFCILLSVGEGFQPRRKPQDS